jgi:glycine/D-amino acid oxidase-like deaminating enzyme
MRICIIGSGIAGLGVAHGLDNICNYKIQIIDSSSGPANESSKLNGAQFDPNCVDRFINRRYNVISTESWKNIVQYPFWILNHIHYNMNCLFNKPLVNEMTTEMKKLGQYNFDLIKQYVPLDKGELWSIYYGNNQQLSVPKLYDKSISGNISIRKEPVYSGSSYDLCNKIVSNLSNTNFSWNTKLKSININNHKIEHIIVMKEGKLEKIFADKFIFCTGSYLGIQTGIPILPIAGTLLEYDNMELNNNPVICSHMQESLIWAKIGNKVRIGGGVEILDNPNPPKKMIIPYLEELKKYKTPNRSHICIRPLTPDGVPYIGSIPGIINGYMVGGLGFWGWTLGFGAGNMLANHISNNTKIPSVFYPNRMLYNKSFIANLQPNVNHYVPYPFN